MRVHHTADRDAAPGPPISARFHTIGQIGLKRHLTKEGYLLCEDVPIARTGWMMYARGETPIEPAPNSPYAMIMRDAETLFSPVTLLSFAGKPVTNDHPPMGVDTRNWRTVTIGTVHNPRQGTGDWSDVVLADLLITDERAIRDVQSGKVEVSAGYNAEYEQIGPGEGRQVNIIGNHVALVEKGRCGPRCAIGDRHPEPSPPLKGKKEMTAATKPRKALPQSVQDAIDAAAEAGEFGSEGGRTEVHVHMHGNAAPSGKPRKVARAADEAPFNAEQVSGADEDPDDDDEKKKEMKEVKDSIKAVADSVVALGKMVKDMMGGTSPTEVTGDKDEEEDAEGKGRTADSAALEVGFRQVLADAEILVPGFSMPTFDAKVKRKITVDSMCATRRRVLDATYATADGKALLNMLTGQQTLDTVAMDCKQTAVLFRSAAGSKRAINNASSTRDSRGLPYGGQQAGQGGNNGSAPPMTIAKLNELNRAKYPTVKA